MVAFQKNSTKIINLANRGTFFSNYQFEKLKVSYANTGQNS